MSEIVGDWLVGRNEGEKKQSPGVFFFEGVCLATAAAAAAAGGTRSQEIFLICKRSKKRRAVGSERKKKRIKIKNPEKEKNPQSRFFVRSFAPPTSHLFSACMSQPTAAAAG